MTKLKTLKDLKTLFAPFDSSKKEMFIAIIKQEAIKWVKILQEEKQRCMPIGEKEDNMGFWFIQDIKADWIITFFNLTEEDLK